MTALGAGGLFGGVAAALNRAVDVEEVAGAIFEHVGDALGAGTVGLWLLDEHRQVLRVAGNVGYRPEGLAALSEIALDAALPGADAIRDRRPVMFASRSERDRRWPTLAKVPAVMEAGVALPLVARGRPLGVLAVAFPTARELVEAEVGVLEAVAEQCGLALDRALLFDAERGARETLEFLAEATRVMVSALDPRAVLDQLVELAVPRLADACTVYVERAGALHRVATRVRGVPDAPPRLGTEPFDTSGATPLGRVYRTGQSEILHQLDDEVIERLYPGRVPATRRFGITSAIVLPLRARATITGVIAFAFMDAGRTRDPDLVYAVNGFAARAGIALDNARRFDDERSTVRTLTDALLPAGVPRVAGYDLAARYVPATGELGGDWYDAQLLPGDALLVGVGDVAGHGLDAAAQMSELRHVARGLAASRRRPRALLDGLGRFTADASPTLLATLAYARFELASGRGRWASAGHPPAILVRGEAAKVLDAPHGPALGISADPEYHDRAVALGPGDLFVLYTDGVVERRDRSFDAGLDSLARLIAANIGRPVDGLADVIVDELCRDPTDDCCVLLLRRASAVLP